MDLSGQQGNRKLMKKAKLGVRRPSELGKFAHFRNIKVKISFKELNLRTRRASSTKTVFRVAVGEEAGKGVLQERSMGKTPR